MKVLDRKRVVDFWKDVVVGLFPWAIFCVCFNMIPFVRGYLSAMAVWSFFLALLCTRIVNFCLPQQAATDDPKNTLLPPTTWAEMITEALDGTLETARLLRCDSSRKSTEPSGFRAFLISPAVLFCVTSALFFNASIWN